MTISEGVTGHIMGVINGHIGRAHRGTYISPVLSHIGVKPLAYDPGKEFNRETWRNMERKKSNTENAL
jgi:hypothetical protein